MTTTGTHNFDPKLAEVYDEAFERAGVSPDTLGTQLIKSAHRSLAFMLNSEWSTIGARRWMVETQIQQSTTAGMTSFTLPVGSIDIIEAVLRRSGQDTEMYGISRNEYLTIVDKDVQGRPDRFYVDRQSGPLGRRAYIWQAGSNATDLVVYNVFKQMQDATGPETTLKDTLDLPSWAFEAMVSGLAMRLAQKFNVDRYDMLRVAYGGADFPNTISGGALDRMRQEDRDRGDIDLYAAFEPRTGRR